MGWARKSAFHNNFLDLNPELNPTFKFQRQARSKEIAEKYMNKIHAEMIQAVEDQKLCDFQKLLREGHKFTTKDLD